jgi:hypothetical protein
MSALAETGRPQTARVGSGVRRTVTVAFVHLIPVLSPIDIPFRHSERQRADPWVCRP